MTVDEAKLAIAQRLVMARESTKLTQVDFAKAIGAQPKTYPAWEIGRSTPKAAIVANLSRIGINPNWLLTGEGAMRLSENASLVAPGTHGISAAAFADDYVLLPRYDVTASAGTGLDVYSENIVDYLAFKRDWVRDTLRLDPSELLLISSDGDSMLPTISHGDLLLVHTAVTRLRDNGIYVLGIDNALVVKRIERRMKGGIVVKSDNPIYEPQAFTAEEAAELTIVGQVRWHARMM